jgi:hypothetical protein
MRLSLNNNRARCLLSLSLLFIISISLQCSSQTPTPPTTTRSGSSPSTNARDSSGIQCKTYCDKFKPGTAFAELTMAAPDANRAERSDQPQLEVTVFKDGFKSGNFAALSSLTNGTKFSMRSGARSTDEEVGLESLVITDVRQGDGNPQSRGLRSESNTVAVRIEGLEPGLNYFFRVPPADDNARAASADEGATIRCQAPICPVDIHKPGDELR